MASTKKPRRKKTDSGPPKSKDDRGEFRSIYVTMPDAPEFQTLSAEARACVYPLKLKLGRAGINVFYLEALPRLTGYSADVCNRAIQELKDGRWIIVDDPLVWLRNGLRFDPSNPLASKNGRMGVVNHLRTLPKMPIINAFVDYYNLAAEWSSDTLPTPSEAPSKPLQRGIPFEAPTQAGKREEVIGMRDEGRGKRERDTSQQQQPSSREHAHTREAGAGRPTDAAAAADFNSATDDQVAAVAEAANAGCRENPKLTAWAPFSVTDPARIQVSAWLADGIPLELICQVVTWKARTYSPQTNGSRIGSLAYFDPAVREAHDTGKSSAFQAPAGSEAADVNQAHPRTRDGVELYEGDDSVPRTGKLTSTNGRDLDAERQAEEQRELERVRQWEAEHEDDSIALRFEVDDAIESNAIWKALPESTRGQVAEREYRKRALTAIEKAGTP